MAHAAAELAATGLGWRASAAIKDEFEGQINKEGWCEKHGKKEILLQTSVTAKQHRAGKCITVVQSGKENDL